MWATLARVASGFFLGAIPGILLGVVMGMNKTVRLMLDTTLSAIYVLPKIAIFPIVMLMFADPFGEGPKIVVVALSVFFLMTINSMAGVRDIDPVFLMAGRNYGARGFQLLRHVIIPAALPVIFAGLASRAGYRAHRHHLGRIPAREAGRGLHHVLLLGGAQSRKDVRGADRRDASGHPAHLPAALGPAQVHAVAARLEGRHSTSSRRWSQRYDVVVVGGGAAGIAAAIGARRSGARTLLVERYGFMGGAATNANVLSYCGFYAQGDERRRVVGGAGVRVLETLAELGFDVAPVRAPSGNWIVMLDPEALKYAMDRIVAEYGVDCRLHCTLIGARRSAARIEAVTLFDHAGPFDVEAAAFVDASGDADLGFAAGVPPLTDPQSQRQRQLASFPVRIGGVPPHINVSRATLVALMEHFGAGDARAHVRRNGGHFLRLPRSNELWWMGIDLATDGLDSADLAAAERGGRDLAWKFFALLRARVPGFQEAYIGASGPEARHS